MRLLISILGLFILFFAGCSKNSPPEDQPQQKIILGFNFLVEGEGLKTDTLIYTNEAGNQYLVNEIQFFISDVTLHNADGSNYLIHVWKDIHYIDSDIPETKSWKVFDNIPVGTYNSVSFTFGINEEKNQSLMFLNPPESYMFWPENLGGGYHYLKMNGKWLDENQQVNPFNFHLGIGQIYYSYPDSITGFVQNHFRVTLPESAFSISENQTQEIRIIMNIENWFRDPNVYDHNLWGGDIMQKQEAMKLGCENGHNVFTALVIKEF